MKLFTEILLKTLFRLMRMTNNILQKVLRMREGEEISVTNGEGALAHGQLYFEGKKALIEVTELQTENLIFHIICI